MHSHAQLRRCDCTPAPPLKLIVSLMQSGDEIEKIMVYRVKKLKLQSRRTIEKIAL